MKVSYTKGRTINTGNYNNTKVEIGAEIQCDEDETSAEIAFQRVKTWVENRLMNEKGQ